MKSIILLFFLFLPLYNNFSAYGLDRQHDKQVIIITIDGLRADIIKEAYTPGLFKLLLSGSYTFDANTVLPSRTLPSHLSLISGLTPVNHSVTTNKWRKEIKKFKSKTIFSTASSNGLKSGIIVGKEKLKPLKTGAESASFEFVKYNDEAVNSIKNRSLDYISNEKPNLVLIHFPEPDLTGHDHHWISDEYLEKVKEVDKSVYSLVQEIIKTNSYKDYLIIITSDHGGIGSSHLIKSDKIQKIPLIILGSRVKKNNMLNDEIYIYDISPTVYDFLGFNIPSNLDGNIINNIYID